MKKLLIASVLTTAMASGFAAPVSSPVGASMCRATVVVSHYWRDHNITFERDNGDAVGIYQVGDDLVLNYDHPCEQDTTKILANPTLGQTLRVDQQYESRLSYPMDKDVVVSFPDDFVGAPEKPYESQ